MAAFENGLYATASTFGAVEDQDSSRPWVKEVTVPETIKRKYPSKHYVYKVVVKWTNDSKTTIYRRYSLFFDFVVKLQQLAAKLHTINPRLSEADLQLPELPSKSLFARSQTHQVAEKRRKKVEEFCQQLILLPPEISESGLVLGFFNIWPDDTLLRDYSLGPGHVISAPVLVSGGADSPPPLLRSNGSLGELTTPTQDKETSPPPLSASTDDNSLESIISHPDEMEHLEQYRVLGNYQRKDSHQVDLFTGQLVHVIEKHDTGWWMIMSDDEQGYAPAAFLEPLDASVTDRDLVMEAGDDEEYEAMETYTPLSEDEVGFSAQDRIGVLSKSMDGWWKIQCNGHTGLAPAALIRRVQVGGANQEAERVIYEELNIHQPPPRRNTLDSSRGNHVAVPSGYMSPRTHPELANIMENIYCDPAPDEDSDSDDHIYKVPRPLTEPEPIVGVVRRRSEGVVSRRTSSGASKRLSNHSQRSQRSSSKSVSPLPLDNDVGEAIYANDTEIQATPIRKPPVAPKPPTKPKPTKIEAKIEAIECIDDLYESMEAAVINTPIVSTTKDSSKQAKPVKALPSELITKRDPPQPSTLADYEDLDELDPPPRTTELIPALDDYVDMSGTDPIEDLQRSEEAMKPHPPSKAAAPPPPPPRPGKLAGKQSLSKSLSVEPELPVFDEEYVLMDSSPIEKRSPSMDHRPPSICSPPTVQSTRMKPAPPPPYSPHKAQDILKKKLSRARSMEDLLSAANDSTPSEPRPHQYSPPLPRSNMAPPLPARNPPPAAEKPLPERDISFLPITKPKPGRTRNIFKRNKQMSESTDSKPRLPVRGGAPERSVSPIARHSISPPGFVGHPPLVHRNSEPVIDVVNNLKKVGYIAVFAFSAASDRCVSFSVGDKCNLIKKNEETGWWLVKVGDKVGWAPGDYWKEQRDRSVSNAPLPGVPPPIIRKPRSHTVATEAPPIGLNLSYNGGSDVATPTSPAKKPIRLPPPKHSNSVGSVNSPAPPLPPANATRRLGSHSSVPEMVSPTRTSHSPRPLDTPPADEYVSMDEATDSIENATWFAGKMERVQADSFLMENGRQREFLVRERTAKDGYYALSVRYHYNIRHFNIDPTPDGQYSMGSLVFPTIDEIITHYQTNSLFIHDTQHVTLGVAVTKRKGRVSEPAAKTNGI